MIKYKNYTGVVEYDDAGKIFIGEVIGLRDMVTFQGRSATELEKSFKLSIDLYLEMCKRDGLEPQKPFSGRFNLRLDPELHRQIAERAALEKTSLNEFVSHILEDAL
jgi:predicted HicB family RNase H-like nuclease